ncbi:helix-turn-helix transcriptional regulator [Naasia lichenicola]|uniref:Helix-turn-helix transcriptional regulator n=1 Tax=Naasia lichenicola TaxID=2565933 RepID=A0A4S4FR60_9MICO|nr:helix-turn-helix transcriptional regulator [Naasia lichenicola]THG32854.1 helix-turn-helix transcriptional regulator [Naasia lichenicola]
MEKVALDDPRVFNEVLGMVIVCGQLSYDSSWWQQAEDLVSDNTWLVDPVNAFALALHERGESDDPMVREELRRGVEQSARSGPEWKLSVLTTTAMRLNWSADETRFINQLLTATMPQPEETSTIEVNTSEKPSGLWAVLSAQAVGALTGLARPNPGYLEARLHGIIAISCAYMGDGEQALEHARIVEKWALPRAVQPLLEDVWHTRSTVALERSDFEGAYALLCDLPVEPSRWSASLWGPAELLDLADACEGVGRPRDADARINLALASGVADLSPRHAMHLSAARAVIEPDIDDAETLFVDSLNLSDQVAAPFDTSRIRVLYARFLFRHRRDPLRARAQVRRAIPDFDALGAKGWTARGNRELASYQYSNPSQVGGALSPQERVVASLAAQGLTNRQIAERLFISSRTVSYHLYNLFPKLGITSRAALRDALNSTEEGGL